MGIRVAWSPETRDLFTAALGADRHRRFLVVERLPEGGWDWVTWQGDRTEIVQTGVADTAAAAMVAAERAAAILASGHLIFAPRDDGRLQFMTPKPN